MLLLLLLSIWYKHYVPSQAGSALIIFSGSLVDSVDPKATNRSSLLLAYTLEQESTPNNNSLLNTLLYLPECKVINISSKQISDCIIWSQQLSGHSPIWLQHCSHLPACGFVCAGARTIGCLE